MTLDDMLDEPDEAVAAIRELERYCAILRTSLAAIRDAKPADLVGGRESYAGFAVRLQEMAAKAITEEVR